MCETILGNKILTTHDLTNLKVGDTIELYKDEMTVCPHCRRVGYQTLYDGVFHVVSELVNDMVWVSDRCNDGGGWIIGEPAKSLEGRVRHPEEVDDGTD